MKFSDVFIKFKLRKSFMGFNVYNVLIDMDWEVANSLSDKDAIKYSAKKFEKTLKLIEKLPAKATLYVRFSDSTCPLCAKYLRLDGCEGCPIKNKTGEDFCHDTPYEDDIFESMSVSDYKKSLPKEIKFLKSLLK